jgi:hypothetical protein
MPMRLFPVVALLLACALPVSGAQPLGMLAQKVRQVWEQPEGEARREMREKSPVKEEHGVDTGKRSAASFSIHQRKAGLLMGPESSFRFKRGRFDEKGFLKKLDLGIQWGIFRYFALPPPKEAKTVPLKVGERTVWVAPSEVQIETPGGTIHLYGTDVYIHVDRKSGATTLYVAEGVAVVEGTEQGERALVEEGYWTYFRPGQPPLTPRRWEPKTTPAGAAEHAFLDDWLHSGPRLLDLSRLDLPRVGPP